MRTILVLAVMALIAGCSYLVSPEDAKQAAINAGLDNVFIVDETWAGPAKMKCSGGDAAVFEVRANNHRGDLVTAYVCCGAFFKGCTVRY